MLISLCSLNKHVLILLSVQYLAESLQDNLLLMKRDLKRMFQHILCQIFSNQCQLSSLKLDISKSYCDIH